MKLLVLTLLPYISKYKFAIIVSYLCSLSVSAVVLFIGYFVRHRFDASSFINVFEDKLNEVVIVIIFSIVVFGILNAISSYLVSWAQSGYIKDIKESLFSKIVLLGESFVDKESSGELQTRLINDVPSVASSLGNLLPNVSISIVIIIGSIVGIFLSNPVLALAVIGCAILIPIVPMLTSQSLRHRGNKMQAADARSGQLVGETLRNLLVVKAFNREQFEIDKTSGVLHERRRLFLSIEWIQVLAMYITVTFALVMITSIVLFAFHQVAEDIISVGEMIAFTYFAVLLIANSSALMSVFSGLNVLVGQSEKIVEILSFEKIEIDQRNLNAVPKSIELKLVDVSFKYPNRDEFAIRSLNVNFSKFKTTAIIGESGSGKSTLFRLLLRSIDPISGNIYCGSGINISEVDLQLWRERIGFVPQKDGLMSGSVKENIIYGKENASDEELRDASIRANAHDFISGLPEGYDSILGEDGSRLSVGQQQRICIARAVLSNPEVYLFDEATSALDAQNERVVTETLSELAGHSTVIVIAHRLETIKQADSIVLLKEGRLVAQDDFSHVTMLPEFQKVISIEK